MWKRTSFSSAQFICTPLPIPVNCESKSLKVPLFHGFSIRFLAILSCVILIENRAAEWDKQPPPVYTALRNQILKLRTLLNLELPVKHLGDHATHVRTALLQRKLGMVGLFCSCPRRRTAVANLWRAPDCAETVTWKVRSCRSLL